MEPVETTPALNAQALGTPNWTAGTGAQPLNKLDLKPAAPAEPVPDTKEQHFEAIRYLLDQLSIGADAPTKATLDNICTRLDEIDPPEKTVKW
jgi:hypothetical protein